MHVGLDQPLGFWNEFTSRDGEQNAFVHISGSLLAMLSKDYADRQRAKVRQRRCHPRGTAATNGSDPIPSASPFDRRRHTPQDDGKKKDKKKKTVYFDEVLAQNVARTPLFGSCCVPRPKKKRLPVFFSVLPSYPVLQQQLHALHLAVHLVAPGEHLTRGDVQFGDDKRAPLAGVAGGERDRKRRSPSQKTGLSDPMQP